MNYAELKTAIASWMHRGDLTSEIDGFIDLFESRASNNLRTYEMENRSTIIPASEYVALPIDFVAVKSFKVGDKILRYAPEHYLIGRTGTQPAYYTITGGDILITPSAEGSEIEMVYYQAIPALSATNTTNWLLTKYQAYYLHGCILEAMRWAKDPSVAVQDQIVGQYENEINNKGSAAKYSSAPLTVIAA